MQSRSNESGVSCCTVETASSESDFVDITSVSLHHQTYDRCATNCRSDELVDSFVYDDDDFDDAAMSGAGDSASRRALLTSVVCPDVSDIPSANGVVGAQSPSSVDKPGVQVAGKTMLPPPFGFPLRSQTEIVSRAMELLDSQVKPEPDDCGGNNNSFRHNNAECFKHAVNSVCHHGDGDIVVQTAKAAETCENVQAAKSTGTNGETLQQQPESLEAEVIENSDSVLQADLQTSLESDETSHHYAGTASMDDNRSVSKTSAVPGSGKTVCDKADTECQQNNETPVTNGALETESSDSTEVHAYSVPATDSQVTTSLREPDVPFMTMPDKDASADWHCEQQAVSSSNCYAEPASDAEFVAVVRRRRRDAGTKLKTQQSDELCSFYHRRPSRPAYTSPKGNVRHSAGRSSPIQMQPASQKLSNPSGVDLWDSTLSAFPALPSLQIRRNSTGDVPAASESNDDGSDLESVKSMQTSSSRQTTCVRSLGTSSYASVVVGNMFTKEQLSASVSQSSASIPQRSPHFDRGLDVSPFCPCSSDPSTSDEVTVHISPVEITTVSCSVTTGLDNSDFMVDSSIIQGDNPCTNQKVGHSDRQKQSGSSTCPRANRCGHAVLFFDTRSKTSSTPVPSLDISFGFDDVLASEVVSSGNVMVTGESHTTVPTPRITPEEPTAAVEFLQLSSVSRPSTSSHTSSASLPRSSFDLRAAQKYLLSAFKEVTQSREHDRCSVRVYGTDFD